MNNYNEVYKVKINNEELTIAVTRKINDNYVGDKIIFNPRGGVYIGEEIIFKSNDIIYPMNIKIPLDSNGNPRIYK